MVKGISQRYIVDYDTQWTHFDLESEKTLYFKAKTPIQEIVSKLEKNLNQNKIESLQVNYQSSYAISNFNKVYRNLNHSYKGWRVRYRKSNSQYDYGSITEKIGYREMTTSRHTLKKILQHRMVWKHDLNSVIEPVEINGTKTCESIAQTLNHQLKQGRVGKLLKTWSHFLEELNQNHQQLVEQDFKLDFLTDKNKNQPWQRFLNNLQTVNHLRKQLQYHSNIKDYTMHYNNVYDVLIKRSKNAKGWRVEFFEDGSSNHY